MTDYALSREIALNRLKLSNESPTSARVKITEDNLRGIYYRITHNTLRESNIDGLVTDLYCEVMRLRAICELVIDKEDYTFAYRWKEKAK